MSQHTMTGQASKIYARWWCVVLCALVALLGLGGGAWLIAHDGVGVLGVNNSVPWGWDVVSFVFWIGLGHAGTLISAILLLSKQTWRGAIARHAELMTLCAIITAGIFPLVHVGRAWMLWAIAPLPVASGVWPNLSSALLWDAVAIGSYFVLSLLFWLIGMHGERAGMERSHALWGRTCVGLAVVLTVLVITVHSVVGCDFAVVFRWHALGIPPYFVCGALLSGMAAVQLIELCLQHPSPATGDICREHLARLTLIFSMAMGLFYAAELWETPQLLWQGGYGIMWVLNVAIPALYWWAPARRNRRFIACCSLGLLIGMWWERVHIIVCRSISFTEGSYCPSLVDVAMLLGGMGLFLSLFLSIAPRMPREQLDPTVAAAFPHAPAIGWVATLGGICGAAALLLWCSLTQGADTAGSLAYRPMGYPYILPPLLVCTLLGAGLALVLRYIISTRRWK